jgi:hypothetical protein
MEMGECFCTEGLLHGPPPLLGNNISIVKIFKQIGGALRVYPVRNNAPLLCSGVGFYNNSSGV